MSKTLEELAEYWADYPTEKRKFKREIRKLFMDLTEQVSFQDPADGSWIISSAHIRREIRKL